MTLKRRGEDMSIRDLAIRKNGEGVALSTARISVLMRQHSEKDPMAGFDTLAKMSRNLLDGMKPKVDESQLFLEKAREKFDSGVLNLATCDSEVLPVTVAIKLYDFLETMHGKAVKADSNFPLKRLAYAAGILKRYFDSGRLTKETKYPSGEATITGALAASKLSLADSLYTEVVRALGDSAAQLELELPQFERRDEAVKVA